MSDIITILATASGQIISGAGSACSTSCNTGLSVSDIFTKVANALTFIIGGASVIMIIIGGLRYVTSNGDAKQAAEGRQTILYSVIGVVVAIAAYAIIQFVTKSLG